MFSQVFIMRKTRKLSLCPFHLSAFSQMGMSLSHNSRIQLLIVMCINIHPRILSCQFPKTLKTQFNVLFTTNFIFIFFIACLPLIRQGNSSHGDNVLELLRLKENYPETLKKGSKTINPLGITHIILKCSFSKHFCFNDLERNKREVEVNGQGLIISVGLSRQK